MTSLVTRCKKVLLVVLLTQLGTSVHAKQPKFAVQLAEVFSGENVQNYLVSEKYDGVRAIWKDGKLRTRHGNVIHAPSWFTQNLPNVWLDGELWSERGGFEFVLSTVSKQTPIEVEWQQLKYMVFDAPNYEQVFTKRANFYAALLDALKLNHVEAVEQFTVNDNTELLVLLTRFTNKGAEGLMLQKADALFTDGRGSNLLKLKPYMDAEAKVIQHLNGKGKYQNSLGALLVHYKNARGQSVEFRIGTGFTDNERDNPPPIGSNITFKYHGYTKNGVPRFASFLRVRDGDNSYK